MDKEKVIDILEYNMAMLTCDMSISRDPEHQDVSPDYYGKDAEDLYYACEYCIDYFKRAIPIEWIEKWWDKQPLKRDSVFFLLRDWERETGIDAEQHAQVIEEMRNRRAEEKENETKID